MMIALEHNNIQLFQKPYDGIILSDVLPSHLDMLLSIKYNTITDLHLSNQDHSPYDFFPAI